MTNTTVYSMGMYRAALAAQTARRRKWSVALLLVLLLLAAALLLVGMLAWRAALLIAVPFLVFSIVPFALYRTTTDAALMKQTNKYFDLQGGVTVTYSFEEEWVRIERKSLLSTDKGEIGYCFLQDVIAVDERLLVLRTPLALPLIVYEPEGAETLLRYLRSKIEKQ